MGINVNVNPAKLQSFSAYVADFSRSIQSECNNLESAVKSLGKQTDSQSMKRIDHMIHDIEEILSQAKPVFDAISNDAAAYSAYLKKLRNISGGS